MDNQVFDGFGVLSRTLVIAVLVWCSFSCDLSEETEKRRIAEADLKLICEPISVPDAASLGMETHRDFRKIVIFKKYRSASSCDAVGRHFTKYFTELGWDPTRMTTVRSAFDFRKDDYLVSVECEASKGDEEMKRIVLSCSWGLG